MQMTPKGRVAPFGNPRIKARLPAPLGLSQVPTSFIASRRQDIRRLLLMTWSHLPDAVDQCGGERKARRRIIKGLAASHIQVAFPPIGGPR